MGTFHKAVWVSSGAGTSRRQRASGVYYWYLPDLLSDLKVALDEDVVADVARAERDLATCASSLSVGIEGVARLLMRSESVASSNIEGLSIGSRRLMRAELQRLEPDNVRYDRNAACVFGNIRAMEQALELVKTTPEVTVEMLQEIHADLCRGTDIEQWGGVVRTAQNWVGGSASNPLSADYVPPAPDEVSVLLDDLVAYINRADVSPVVQAALVHSQFESIHPFADGNGRLGRALIHVCLGRRGVSPVATPPISLALATNKQDYFDSLSQMQRVTNEEEQHEAVNDWVSCFCSAVSESCGDMERIAQDMAGIRTGWEGMLGRVRAGSSLELMLNEMQALPVFSVETMVRATGRTKQAVGLAVSRLLEAGIIRQTNQGKRSRVFEAPDVLEEFAIVERRLASPARDTSVEPPSRRVPDRPR